MQIGCTQKLLAYLKKRADAGKVQPVQWEQRGCSTGRRNLQ